MIEHCSYWFTGGYGYFVERVCLDARTGFVPRATSEHGLGAEIGAHDEARLERKMKAARFSRFGGPEVLEIVDLPDPHPGPGQVRIAVRAAGVNPSDWKKRGGLMDEELPQTMG